MTLYVYNTLSRKKEHFVPIKGRHVNMFVCGQTVYDDAHLGHAKTYINFDVIARWLRTSGYQLTYVQNITDVEDKIVNRAAELGVAPMDLARTFEKRFLDDIDKLGAKQSVDMYPRSHDFIKQIAVQIQQLIDNGYAYRLDGDIYYDVDKFRHYTDLSGMKLDELKKHRIEPKQGKRNVYDFVLWKSAKPGEPSWKIKLSIEGRQQQLDGRPGWHIEDTAVTCELFGPQYDIHGGAIELIFPHHTNEIAQAEAATGKSPMVKYWLHAGIMTIKGEKMSKSLKNFIRISDAISKYGADAVRMLVLSTHYRKSIEYTDQLLANATKTMHYLNAALSVFYNMGTDHKVQSDHELVEAAKSFEQSFADAMDDDFNTPLALSALISIVTKLRNFGEMHGSVGKQAKSYVLDQVTRYAAVLGLFEDKQYTFPIAEEAKMLIVQRESFRKAKQFDKADAIRQQLATKYHIAVEDTEYGAVWYRL